MLIDIFAGTLGGIAVVIVGHPFDTTKTRLQTAPIGFYPGGTINCVRKTWNVEGFRGFYAGIWSPLAGQMFFRAASFTTFHNSLLLQRRFSNTSSALSANQLMVSGAVTGFVIAFIECPIDFVKTKLQIQIFEAKRNPSFVPSFVNVTQCVQYFVKNHGWRSFYQGLSGTIIRNVPANAVFFPVNELVKAYFARRDGLKSARDVSLLQNMTAGASAGLCYWVGTYPLDVIKAKMQGADITSRRTWIQTAGDIWRSGGFAAYRQGLLPCAMRAVPACAVMFTTVDFVRAKLS